MCVAIQDIRHVVLIPAVCTALLVTGLDGVPSTVGGAELLGAFSERQQERREMVDSQLKGWSRATISDAAVFQAMLKVPGHFFVPPDRSALAYRDSPVPIGHGQTVSQPHIVCSHDSGSGTQARDEGAGSGDRVGLPGGNTCRDNSRCHHHRNHSTALRGLRQTG